MTTQEMVNTITGCAIEISPTFASINVSNRSPRFISVTNDETSGGTNGFYFFDGSILNVISATPLNQLPTLIANPNYLSSTQNAN